MSDPGDKLAPVVVSHGMGGALVGHHDMAETLADADFVVAAVNHPGDTTSDVSRHGELSVMVERPTDIKRLTDFMLGASPAASNIDPERIGFFGVASGKGRARTLHGCHGLRSPRLSTRSVSTRSIHLTPIEALDCCVHQIQMSPSLPFTNVARVGRRSGAALFA